jgi:hypothetical protein
MPYYDDRMSEFICRTPEAFLADRRLQIAHIKQDDSLAKITWQAQKPFNLNNYSYNKSPYNLPFRVYNKTRRIQQRLLGHPYIQRNWELQFLGADNAKKLEGYLFDDNFNKWIPEGLIRDFYQDFNHVDPVQGSHAISMLLTLSLWNQQNHDAF